MLCLGYCLGIAESLGGRITLDHLRQMNSLSETQKYSSTAMIDFHTVLVILNLKFLFQSKCDPFSSPSQLPNSPISSSPTKVPKLESQLQRAISTRPATSRTIAMSHSNLWRHCVATKSHPANFVFPRNKRSKRKPKKSSLLIRKFSCYFHEQNAHTFRNKNSAPAS